MESNNKGEKLLFSEAVKKHMVSYKKSDLQLMNYQAGFWRLEEKNKFVTMEYILPISTLNAKEAVSPNLLRNYRESFLHDRISDIKYHDYAHHLNSSQIMCINFFFPFWYERKLDIVINALGLELFSHEQIDYDGVCFEKESTIDKNQHSRTATSFDFYIPIISDKPYLKRSIYFEIKYCERNFGIKDINDHNIGLYNRVYKKHAERVLSPVLCFPEAFLSNYQIARNLIHIDAENNDYLVLIYPSQNEEIANQCSTAKSFYLKECNVDYLIVETWEDLFNNIFSNIGQNEALIAQMDAFYQKYLNIPMML